MKALIRALLQRRRARGFAGFERACRDPERAQQLMLTSLLQRSGGTAFARRIGATPDRVRTVEDLRANVPLTSYADIEPEVLASLGGASDQLIPGKPGFFALTSGTTGRAKYLPIDEAYRKAFQAPMQHYLFGIVRDHLGTFSKKVLYMVGPPEVEALPGGAVAGTISGYNYRALPPLLARFGAVPWQVFAVRDPRAQIHATASLAMRQDISFAVAITTAPLAALGEAMRDHGEALLRDMHDGTLTISEGQLSSAERDALSPFAKRDRARARRIEQAAARHGSLVPQVVWPDLALVSCWAHAGAATHLHLFPELFGDVPVRSAVYSATEGWINVPMRDDSPSGALAIESGVYELELLDASGQPTGTTCLPHEAEVGVDYGMVLSSGCGLFRYQLGDRVRVTGFFHRTPELHFVQKLGAVLSLAHDATSEEHVAAAIAELESVAPVSRWVFGPSVGFPPRYRLAVAAQEGLDTGNLAHAFDAALGRANLGYEADREAGILAPAEVVAIDASAFGQWEAASRAAVGHQTKPTRFVMTAEQFPEAARPEGS